MSFIKTKELTIGYKNSGKSVLSNININESEGNFISLLGENGSGKSTLLKTLTGLLKPISGEIELGNHSLTTLATRERSKILSVVLTERYISGNLSVEELVSMGRYPYQSWNIKMTEEDTKIVNEALEKCELEDIRTESIHELSDGQKQKALIARAVAQNTTFLFLDEPTNHLDIKNKYTIIKLLKELSTQGKKILMTTHDIDLASKFCDQLWLIDKERNVVCGNPEELIETGKLDTIFNIPLKELMGR